MLETGGRTIVVFDTDCILCSRWVRFLLERETTERMIFVSTWCATGLDLAERHGLLRADLDRTYLVIKDGAGLTRSTAGLALLAELKSPWPWIGRVLAVMPQVLRDKAYDAIAARRYRWFGRRDRCFVPPPNAKGRFIDS